MQNRLQELTDRLYNEGLSKGKQEGEAILADARKNASEIIEKAKKEAESIVATARKEAESLKAKTEGDLRLAAGQSIAATRQAIENMVVCRLTEKEVSSALSSADFVKEMLTATVKAFSASSDAESLEIVLPESLKKATEPFVKKELSTMFKGGLEVSFNAYKHATKDATLNTVDGLTPDQRFFVAYAGVWAANITDEEIRNLTKMDPHSLGRWRVNGALPHINAWYDAFNVKPGDKLYLPENERLKLW